jgi:uncharacterized delta-60 repeat protein
MRDSQGPGNEHRTHHTDQVSVRPFLLKSSKPHLPLIPSNDANEHLWQKLLDDEVLYPAGEFSLANNGLLKSRGHQLEDQPQSRMRLNRLNQIRSRDQTNSAIGLSFVSSDTVRETWVKHFFSQLAPAEDNPWAITIDGNRNIYVTGVSTALPFGAGIATVKYDSSGKQLWQARYDVAVLSMAKAIAVDDSGNVYVTGWSVGSGARSDYLTIKYNSSGVEQWIAHYNGPANHNDAATAIAVDALGNVYVTGYSYGSGTLRDYATIKYNASGTQQWVARYNGPGKERNEATALAVDNSGNVYVTGWSVGLGTGEDYATIKYNSSGVQQWVVRYNGPGNTWDVARALAIDSSGNVYVTGYSYGSGTSHDYATIKYNSSGVQQWLARYNGPGNDEDAPSGIAVDALGNVYVTGYSYGSGTLSDYATIKYNASGIQQWVARYNGPANRYDYAGSIAVDSSGNVYVTGTIVITGTRTDYAGSDYATIKYNASGVQEWVARYNGPGDDADGAKALALDAAGNVYVTGRSVGSGTGENYATIKYDASGIQQWVARYTGPGNSLDEATALAVDGSGNVYVTGRSVGSGTQGDYATIKYSGSGRQEWVARYNGPGNDWDIATAIAVDNSGNVYVTGWSVGSGTERDYATIKYNSSGVQQWVVRYNGPGNSLDEATALAVDGSGNVYVTGWSVGSGTERDYATIKYSGSGVQEWVARYNGPRSSVDQATALAVDGSSNVYVTGWSVGLGTLSDYATIKYNSSGVQQWVARYNGPANDRDLATALAVDGSSNVYVTGWSVGLGTLSDYATIKYNSSGVQQWVARYNGPANDRDQAAALAVDGLGNVYVTGRSVGSGTGEDYATIKHNPSGIQQWVARYNGPANSYDVATAITVDWLGNLYVTGWSIGSGNDYATIKYDASGAERWIAWYNGPGGGPADIPTGLVVDASGNVYVTGTSSGAWGWSIYTTIKYTQILTSVQDEHVIPKQYVLSQNYPNPFNSSTTIRYGLRHSSKVELHIYSLLGQRIATLVDEEKQAGHYQVLWDASQYASGIYFYRMTASDHSTGSSDPFVATKKLILLR